LFRWKERRVDKQIGKVLVSDMRLRTSVYNTNIQGHCKCERTTVPCWSFYDTLLAGRRNIYTFRFFATKKIPEKLDHCANEHKQWTPVAYTNVKVSMKHLVSFCGTRCSFKRSKMMGTISRWKIFSITCFDTRPVCNRQTDRHSDIRTNGQNWYNNIAFFIALHAYVR